MIEKKRLIREQIESVRHEILLMNFIFSFVNTLSILFLVLVFEKLVSNPTTLEGTYIQFLEVTAAIFAPYLTIIGQGFYFPRLRKLNTLRHLLFKETWNPEEQEFIYDKQ